MTKKQKLYTKNRAKIDGALKLMPKFARNAQPSKQPLARASAYSGGDMVIVTTSKGEVSMPLSVASMPKYGRRSSPGKFDQRSENRRFNNALGHAVTECEASRKNPQATQDTREVVSSVVAVLAANGVKL